MALGKNINKGTKVDEAKKDEPANEIAKESAQTPAPAKPETPLATQEVIETTEKKEVPVAKASKPESAAKSLHDLNQNIENANVVDENNVMLVVFPVGDEEYAFVIDQIKEVVPIPPISPVPQTKNYIRGVANVRGNVLAVVDLAKRFGLKVKEEDYSNYVIVIKSEEIKVAVVSSQVPETLMVAESKIDDTADVMRKTIHDQGFIKGVVKKDNRMIILIDILEMVENEQSING